MNELLGRDKWLQSPKVCREQKGMILVAAAASGYRKAYNRKNGC